MNDSSKQPKAKHSQLEAAIKMGEHGLRVVPIGVGQKFPPIQEWQKQASADQAVFERWFASSKNSGSACPRKGRGTSSGAGFSLAVRGPPNDSGDESSDHRSDDHRASVHPGSHSSSGPRAVTGTERARPRARLGRLRECARASVIALVCGSVGCVRLHWFAAACGCVRVRVLEGGPA